MFKLKLSPYFAPVTDIKPAGGNLSALSSQMGKEEIIDFLGKDDIVPDKDDKTDDKDDDNKILPKDKKDKKEDKEDKDDELEVKDDDKETEEEDELAELESELEEPSDEQLELTTPVRRKEILAKYPKLFKDFPYLEKAYYREQQFTEVFPTITDAKEAHEKSETLDKFEDDLMSGNTENMLKAAKTNPKSFAKLVDNYMTTLAKVDKDAHIHVIGNIIKHTIIGMANESKRANNEALMTAASLLNQYVFGTSDFIPPQSLVIPDSNPEIDEKEQQLTTRERQFQQKRLDSATSDLNSRINNSYKATIEAHIDPKDSMSEYVKKTATREALENLESLISTDRRFKVLVDKLWEAAIKDEFSRESLERVRSAFLSKAKTLLPSVIQKARNAALRGMGKRVKDDTDDTKQTPKKGPADNGRPRSQQSNSGRIKDAKDIPKGMSTLDFLMSDDD